MGQPKFQHKENNLKHLPKYGQFSNGCGLASLLMLLNPEENPNIKEFLEKEWDYISSLFDRYHYNSNEYHWALVLQYLLLKCLGNSDDESRDPIYEFFEKRIKWIYHDQKLVNKSVQESQRSLLLEKNKPNEAFTYGDYLGDSDFLTPLIIMKNIHVMKTDAELKVLAEIFDFKFEYQEFDDITGAITFLAEELTSKTVKKENARKKWNTLEMYSNDSKYLLLYGKAHHWLAIKDVYKKCPEEAIKGKVDNKKSWKAKNLILEVNDPAQKRTLKLDFDDIQLSDRILVFSKRSANKTESFKPFSLFEPLLKLTKEDAPVEVELWRQYLIKRYKLYSEEAKEKFFAEEQEKEWENEEKEHEGVEEEGNAEKKGHLPPENPIF